MAVLADVERFRVWAQAMRQGALGPLAALTKADLRAAVDATDAWIDANAAGFNSALPQPARGQLTTAQKTLLFCWVAMRRAGQHRAREDG